MIREIQSRRDTVSKWSHINSVIDHNSLDIGVDLRYRVITKGSVNTLFESKTNLKSFREIFRAFWTDSVSRNVQIRDFVVLMLQNVHTRG